MKWNGNNGYEHGARAETSAAEEEDDDVLAPQALCAIEEDEAEEVSESDDDEALVEEEAEETTASAVDHVPVSFTAADIPQAFSCFSYRHSNRRLLVCDLQGVLNKECSPPRFELTDPVIHYNSRSGRRNVHGRTDHGQKGINRFFSTHECGELCDALTKKWFNPQEGENRWMAAGRLTGANVHAANASKLTFQISRKHSVGVSSLVVAASENERRRSGRGKVKSWVEGQSQCT